MNLSVFNRSQNGLGAFLGVFTPTILTILGVIMYLRVGWVVGQVGLAKSLFIVVLAHLITISTSLSLSAIATNTRVGTGGAYFMISRSLGLEIGGAIGLPLFFSQTLSVTLYAYGLAESLRIVWPGLPLVPAAFLIILLVGGLSFRGASFALKMQLPVMVLIGLSLLALAIGAIWMAPPETVTAPPEFEPEPFWGVFAVFFPALTGIMAGLGLSGDLADPRKALPRGTLSAVLTGFVVYLLIPVLLSAESNMATLRDDPLIWTRIAVLGPWLVLPGLWGAIFSSAVGSMLGAPRTLRALANDRLMPGLLRSDKGPTDEPMAGYIVTLAIAMAAVLLGDLNTVAVVVTMFFLSIYGLINLVAAVEKIAGNPYWRPTLNIPWFVSLPAALGCFGVMFLIHWPATVLALVVELSIWLLLKRKKLKNSWGDVRRDLYEAVIRWCLLRLSRRPMTARNWRPHIIVFVRDIEKRLDLVQYGIWFSQNRGVVTVCELIEDDVMTMDIDVIERTRQLDDILKSEGMLAFGEVNVVNDIERGIPTVAQANSLAGLESNTLLLGWPDDPDRLVSFLKVARHLGQLQLSMLIGKLDTIHAMHEGKKLSIDIWWRGLKRNGDLLLLLSYLLSQNPEWHGCRIRILCLASNELMVENTESFLGQLVDEIRIDAEVVVKLKEKDRSVLDILYEESRDTDLVMLGLAVPEEGDEQAYAERMSEMVEKLPNCFFGYNGNMLLGDLVTPEETEDAEETDEDAEETDEDAEETDEDETAGRDAPEAGEDDNGDAETDDTESNDEAPDENGRK